MPDDHNPFEETLAAGQYVSWEWENMVDIDMAEAPHKQARLEAEEEYLKAAAKQKHRYENNFVEITREFNEGDTVGIKISDVDAPTLMPVFYHAKSKKSEKNTTKVSTNCMLPQES